MAEKDLTLQELLYLKEKTCADKLYLRQPIDGKWHEYTWGQTMDQARRMAHFLTHELGLKKGDRVSILSKNCAQWFMADFAILIAGLVSVPIYATMHKDKIKYVLDHSESKAIFVGKLDDWDKMEPGIPDNVVRIAMPYDTMPAKYQWNDILDKHEPLKDNFIPKMEDLQTLMYTSGTTGNPKGVMLDYQGWANIRKLGRIEEDSGNFFQFPNPHRMLSYLPLAHIYERLVVEFGSLDEKRDWIISFVESIETFTDNLKDTSPTAFVSVPRLWVQFQLGILEKISQERLDFLLKIPVVSSIVKTMLRKALGLNDSVANLSGAAPLPASLIDWYAKIGIKISQGYGMTENFAYATLTPPNERCDGKVGKAREGVVAKISEEGELLLKSPVMMRGYYKNPEATKAAFTDDGFLRTGDKAEIDAEGYIKIIGRVKDSFKTDKGEFIEPNHIEEKFAKNSNIEQLCLIGMNLVQPVMVVSLSAAAKKKDKKKIEKSLLKTLHDLNPNLTKYEKISHVLIAKDEWSVDNEMTTPTLKIRRNSVAKYYTPIAKKKMTDDNEIIWEAK